MTDPQSGESASPEASALGLGGDLFGIEREVLTHSDLRGELLTVVCRRAYPVPVDALFTALTDPGQLAAWFLPVTGELQPGGTFQAVGNAGGEIRRCVRPTLLRFTWGDDSSIVELRFTTHPTGPAGPAASSTLELRHTVPLELAGNGTGAFFVGPGWDAALYALGAYLDSTPIIRPGTPAEQIFNKRSLLAWALVVEASDTATGDEVAAAVETTLPMWAPDL